MSDDDPVSELRAFHFGVAGDRTHLLLTLKTEDGVVRLKVGQAIAVGFAEAARENVDWLVPPDQPRH